jgi:Xaa-Pro aminopeptidase
MKKLALIFSLLLIAAASGPVAVRAGSDGNEPAKVIRVAPKAPVFTAAERQAELKARRDRVAAAMSEGGMLILMSADPKLYANDVNYVFRQENNLFYLTSLDQNGVSLVMVKKGGSVKSFVFLPKRNPQFETWNGRMLGNDEAAEISGIDNIVDAAKWPDFLVSLKSKKEFDTGLGASVGAPSEIYLMQGDDTEYGKEEALAKELSDQKVSNAAPIFANLRLVKSPYELKQLQHAIDITTEAIGRSMGMAGRANWEYEVQAEVEYTFRRRNADFWGYPSIVGCGPNATTLHYEEAQGKVSQGELLLMDVGAEYGHYTADVTRTFPVNGKFSNEQAEIYQIVYDAQEAAAATMKPGVSFGVTSRAAADVIEDGLVKLGLVTAKGATYDVEFNGTTFKRPQYTLWYMHGWGHWLGMNVHDVGQYGNFEAGMVTTNEPGIYIRRDALDYLKDTPANNEMKAKIRNAFEKYRTIGVRIEDDMLVTKDGVVWMTKDLPRSIKDVEAFIAGASKEMSGYAGLGRSVDELLAVRRSVR